MNVESMKVMKRPLALLQVELTEEVALVSMKNVNVS